MAAAVETGLMYFSIITGAPRAAAGRHDQRPGAAEVDRGDGQMTRLDDVEITAFASMLGGAGAETVQSSSATPRSPRRTP